MRRIGARPVRIYSVLILILWKNLVKGVFTIKNNKKIGFFKILGIGILGGIGSLLLALLGIGINNIIFFLQNLLFVNSNTIVLIQGSFISRFDGVYIILGIACVIAIALFYKFKWKLQAISIFTIIWFGILLATIFSCTVFNHNSLLN